MQRFRYMLLHLFLIAAIGFASISTAFGSEIEVMSHLSSNVDSFQTAQNTKSILFEEISVSEVTPVFYQLNLKYPSNSGWNSNSPEFSEAHSESMLQLRFLLNKNKYLHAQLFPFHFFW